MIVSQARQVNFSRTVWITFHCRGITSSVSVTSSPSLASLPPQHGQALGPGMTTRSRGRCAGSGARTGFRRVKLLTVAAGLARRRFGGRLVLGGGGLQLLELQLQLVEQPAAALGRWPEPLAPQLGDHQLQMRDHRLGAGRPGLGLPAPHRAAATSAACSVATSSGSGSDGVVTSPMESRFGAVRTR